GSPDRPHSSVVRRAPADPIPAPAPAPGPALAGPARNTKRPEPLPPALLQNCDFLGDSWHPHFLIAFRQLTPYIESPALIGHSRNPKSLRNLENYVGPCASRFCARFLTRSRTSSSPANRSRISRLASTSCALPS